MNIKKVKLCGLLIRTQNVAPLVQTGVATELLHTLKALKLPARRTEASATREYFAQSPPDLLLVADLVVQNTRFGAR